MQERLLFIDQIDNKENLIYNIIEDSKIVFAVKDTKKLDFVIDINIDSPNVSLELYGICLLENSENISIITNVIHHAPKCKSRVSVKAVLKGKSLLNWSGDVIINKSAKDTDSFEENRNLVLNKGPKVTSIPNLEILTGDILGAGHASATEKFNDQQMFYLQSRGISKQIAENLVINGFINSQLELINDDEITKIIKGDNNE